MLPPRPTESEVRPMVLQTPELEMSAQRSGIVQGTSPQRLAARRQVLQHRPMISTSPARFGGSTGSPARRASLRPSECLQRGMPQCARQKPCEQRSSALLQPTLALQCLRDTAKRLPSTVGSDRLVISVGRIDLHAREHARNRLAFSAAREGNALAPVPIAARLNSLSSKERALVMITCRDALFAICKACPERLAANPATERLDALVNASKEEILM